MATNVSSRSAGGRRVVRLAAALVAGSLGALVGGEPLWAAEDRSPLCRNTPDEDTTPVESGKPDEFVEFTRIEDLFLGTTPYAQEKGAVEVALVGSLLEAPDEREVELALEAEYGITSCLTVGIEVPYGFLHPEDGGAEEAGAEPGLAGDEDGIGDIELSALYSFTRRDAPAVLSLSVAVSLPTGDEERGLGEGVVAVSPAVLLAGHFGPAALYGNVGMDITVDEAALTYDAAGTYAIGPFNAVLELNGTTGGEEAPVYLAPGLAWEIVGDEEEAGYEMQFEFGVPIGLNADAADWGLTALLVVGFGT